MSAASERAYLDHAATTALRPAALAAYVEAAGVLGNPAAQHSSGRRARGVLDDALEHMGELLGVPTSWLLLTSGGTEADNLAIRGAALAAQKRDPGRLAVAVAASDHPAVLESARALRPEGLEVREIPVGREGLVEQEALGAALADGAVSLLSAALVNNETGAIQDLPALSRIAHEQGALVHTDAVQAAGHIALPRIGAGEESPDLMTLSGHKIGAPIGVGLLVAPPHIPLQPVLVGGGQQRAVRSGTLDAPHAAALAAALAAAIGEQEREAARLAALAAQLHAGIAHLDPRAVLTGEGAPRSPHIVHALFPGADQDSLLLLLDQEGIDASAGSACTAGVTQSSHVLAAMGVDEELARGALRFSLGWTSTAAQIDRVLAALPQALERARAVRGLRRRSP